MNPPDPPSTLHFFVDEAGDPTLFGAKGHILVGQEGCSKTFILGKLDVDDPAALHVALEQLRADLLADRYFKRVPSMQVGRGKTARAFHAKDDVPEVRREVFMVLMRFDLRFYGAIRQKSALLDYVRLRNEREAGYRYRGDELYDTLVKELFRRYHPRQRDRPQSSGRSVVVQMLCSLWPRQQPAGRNRATGRARQFHLKAHPCP